MRYHLTALQLDPELWLLCVWRFTFSTHVCLGFLWVPRFLPTSEKHAGRGIGYFTFHLSVNMCANACVYDALCLIQGVLIPHAGCSWDRL